MISGGCKYFIHLMGYYPDYYRDYNLMDSKIPNIYLRFYKASLECLADIMQPVHYPPENVPFPTKKGLLDEKCQFNVSKPIRDNVPIPEKWQMDYDDTFIILKDDDKIISSLSGGGDSMTMTYLLCRMGYDVTAVMVDYNNRDTCPDEVKMVHWWCSQLGIELYVMHIEDIKRSRQACLREIYEPVTRKMRINAYKKVAEIISPGKIANVPLAHNDDDRVENIFSNLSKHRSMYDLGAIKKYYLDDDGVWMFRPFRNVIGRPKG